LRSIDLAPVSDERLSNILAHLNLADRVDLVVGDANIVELGGPYDFVLIDGDHSYEGAKRDHNRWGAAIRPGGYIIHHDMADARPYASQWKSLAQLRHEVLQSQSGCVEMLFEVGSTTIFKRLDSSWTEI
jgi:predicted O-methyltransferase YrrM